MGSLGNLYLFLYYLSANFARNKVGKSGSATGSLFALCYDLFVTKRGNDHRLTYHTTLSVLAVSGISGGMGKLSYLLVSGVRASGAAFVLGVTNFAAGRSQSLYLYDIVSERINASGVNKLTAISARLLLGAACDTGSFNYRYPIAGVVVKL